MGRTNGNLALKRTITVIPPIQEPDDLLLRVAAYCRVSSDSSDQLNSFAAQLRHFTDSIQEHKNWKLVDIYADEGITGTSTQKRDEFHRLMEDCRKGRIDKVLVKSISRFARNSEDLLSAIRELKAMGIGVFFEEQNIDSKEASGETLLAILAACAQSESESISRNVKLGYKSRMELGTYLPSSVPYGYRLKNKEIVIEPEEAKVVCYIFHAFLAGDSRTTIMNTLNTMDIKTQYGNPWRSFTLNYILTNEKYIGDSMWGKTYRTDSFPSVQVKNKGERKRYYVEDSHPAILNREAYDAVQQLIAYRKQQYGNSFSESPSVFRKKMECGCCSAAFRMKTIREIQYVVCLTHHRDRTKCGLMPIQKSAMETAFLRLYYNLKHDGYGILVRLVQELEESRYQRMLWHPNVIAINKRISELSNQSHSLTQLQVRGIIDPGVFTAQSAKLAEQLRQAKREKARFLESEVDEALSASKEILECLDAGPDYLDHFDEELFCEFVEKIIVESNEHVRFRLINGLELTEDLI